MNRLLHTDNINSISTQFNRKCTYYLFNIPTSTENGVSKCNFSNSNLSENASKETFDSEKIVSASFTWNTLFLISTSVVISTLSQGSRLSAHLPPPTMRGKCARNGIVAHSGLVATCAREKMPGAKLKSVSPAGMEGNGFTVARCFVRLWSLDAVVSATDASNCVASLFLEPRTDIPRRKRDQRFVDDEDGINFSR